MRPLLIEILNELGSNSNYYGRYKASLNYLLEALEIARDMDLIHWEATVLVTLSGTYDFLGRHAETSEALKQAGILMEKHKDLLGLAKCNYNLAYSVVSKRPKDFLIAVQYAEKALQYFVQTENFGWQASTHTALGYFHWLGGQSDQAVKNLDSAIEIHQRLGELLFIPENYAYKGLVYIQKGDTNLGLKYAERAVRELKRLNIGDVAAEIYYALACAHIATGNNRNARTYIKLAYEIYNDFARGITDDEAKSAYFERDPIIRRLMNLVYEFGIASPPKRKSLDYKIQSANPNTINLEIISYSGRADLSVHSAKGISALRRARIKRILNDGSVHGNQVTIKQISELLNVSTRTIHRDLKMIERDHEV